MPETKPSQTRTKAVFSRAEEILVGGVNSPVRAFRSVGGEPLVIARAQGAHVWDLDGNEFTDYICSWGPMILGHCHPAVVAAIQDQASRGLSFGMTSELEVELAERVIRAMPAIEKIRFVSSGTEAAMSAARLARGFTKRNLILKFEGCYHGHADSFLSEAGSGLATLGISASPGVPDELARLTINVPYNDLAAVEKVFAQHPKQIAALFVEPVAANMGVVPPAEGFLDGLRAITEMDGALLIFDEVISGFRVAYGGAQSLYKIRPDLTILGKIIGGGLPVAAYGGRRDVMSHVAPLGPVYQAGTLSGNPMGMRAGIETLNQLEVPTFYESLNSKAQKLVAGISTAMAKSGIAASVSSVGSLLTLFFSSGSVRNYSDAKKCDTARFGKFFRAMIGRSMILPPSQFEAWFVSAAHTDTDISNTISAVEQSLKECV